MQSAIDESAEYCKGAESVSFSGRVKGLIRYGQPCEGVRILGESKVGRVRGVAGPKYEVAVPPNKGIQAPVRGREGTWQQLLN
jgi:hypothetical protein